MLFGRRIVPPASPVRAKGKIDLSPLLATSPRLLVAAKVTEETRALVYAVERPLGKEQSRVKLQTRDRGKRATGVEGSTSGRTKKLREIYRDCAGGPSSLKGTEERWRGRRKCQLKSRRVSRECRAHFFYKTRSFPAASLRKRYSRAAVKWHEPTQTNARFRRGRRGSVGLLEG